MKTKQEQGRTPGEWKTVQPKNATTKESELDTGIIADINGAERIIAECFGRVGKDVYLNSQANAAFIVRACNAHDELLTDLKVFLDAVDGDPRASQFFDSTFFKKVKADITKAEGRD